MFSKLRKALERNEFYRDNLRRLMWLTLLSLVGNVVLVIALLFSTGGHGLWYFYASTGNGKLIPLQARVMPVLSDSAVLAWVNRVVPQLYTMNFLNYRHALDLKRVYFTDFGWKAFLRAFSPTLKQIIAQQYDVRAAPSDVPIITNKGIYKGKYMWMVQVPLIISYQHGKQEATQNVVWNLLLQKRDNTKSRELLGIAQVVQKPRSVK